MMRNKNGQNVLEYTLLIMIVAAALAVMVTYIQRSMNYRLKQVQDELNYHSDDK